MPRISVNIVGSQASIAASLMALSPHKNIQITGCMSDAADILGRMSDEEPSIVLIDFAILSEGCYAVLDELRRSYPKSKLIYLCEGADQVKLIDAFRHGASGYLETTDREAYLAKVIHAVSEGEAWVSRRFVSKIAERLTRP